MSDIAAPRSTAAGQFHLVREMARNWWVFMLRGAVSVLFGIMVWLAPGLGLAFVLGVLAAWMAVEGVSTLYQAARNPPERNRFWLWLDGIVSILAAVAILLAPGLAAVTLVFVTGFWMIAVGVLRLVLAFRLSSVLMGLLGAVSVLIGAWLIADPGPGLLALIWVVGIQAVAGGFLLAGLGWRLRRIHHDPHGPAMGRG